ncbi:hypothetical protein Hdeb2414_s0010g00346371 [Helianthus debilis subsp. tardiflorus]
MWPYLSNLFKTHPSSKTLLRSSKLKTLTPIILLQPHLISSATPPPSPPSTSVAPPLQLTPTSVAPPLQSFLNFSQTHQKFSNLLMGLIAKVRASGRLLLLTLCHRTSLQKLKKQTVFFWQTEEVWSTSSAADVVRGLRTFYL